MNKTKIEAARFEVFGETCQFVVKEYDNGRPALQVVSENGEPFGVLTVNMPDSNIPDGCAAIKDYSENVPLAAAAMETGLFKDTHITAEGMPVWQFV